MLVFPLLERKNIFEVKFPSAFYSIHHLSLNKMALVKFSTTKQSPAVPQSKSKRFPAKQNVTFFIAVSQNRCSNYLLILKCTCSTLRLLIEKLKHLPYSILTYLCTTTQSFSFCLFVCFKSAVTSGRDTTVYEQVKSASLSVSMSDQPVCLIL